LRDLVDDRDVQLFLERISIAMPYSVPRGAAFLDGKAAFAPPVRQRAMETAPTEKLRREFFHGIDLL
jgi:hypothetical protein